MDQYGGNVPDFDAYAAADWTLTRLAETSACRACGSPDPARLGDGGCSDCRTYPHCGVCRTWVGDGTGWLPGYVWTWDETGAEMRVCARCWEGTR